MKKKLSKPKKVWIVARQVKMVHNMGFATVYDVFLKRSLADEACWGEETLLGAYEPVKAAKKKGAK